MAIYTLRCRAWRGRSGASWEVFGDIITGEVGTRGESATAWCSP
jgi:hypothetical protein